MTLPRTMTEKEQIIVGLNIQTLASRLENALLAGDKEVQVDAWFEIRAIGMQVYRGDIEAACKDRSGRQSS